MSANAPAASAKKSSGNVVDATIHPTQVLELVISNINHDAATAWMKVPVAEKTVAAHSARN
jgi:hypothetical protein